jgi:hypothetical protein
VGGDDEEGDAGGGIQDEGDGLAVGVVAASRLPAVLDQIDLIDLDQRIRMLARTVTSATVRSLDAIHPGTAQRFRSPLTSFVTYDKYLLDAAAGVPADSPA